MSKVKISYISLMLHIIQLLNTKQKSINIVSFYINSLSPAENMYLIVKVCLKLCKEWSILFLYWLISSFASDKALINHISKSLCLISNQEFSSLKTNCYHLWGILLCIEFGAAVVNIFITSYFYYQSIFEMTMVFMQNNIKICVCVYRLSGK